MRRSLCAYLQDIADAVDAIRKFSNGLDLPTFESDDLIRSAVERKFEIIGEAVRQATHHFPGATTNVPDLQDTIQQRNHIAHRYFDIDAQVIWSTIHGDLSRLEEEIGRLKAIHCS